MKLLRATCQILSFTFLTSSLYAQKSLHAYVVSSSDKRPIAGATVQFLSPERLTGATDVSGMVTFKNIRFPSVLEVRAVGFRTQGISLKKNSEWTDTLYLEPAGQELNQVVVTAGRVAQRLEDVPQKIEVISGADIQKIQALDVTDILKKSSSVDVIQYPGILSGVGFRGFRPQYSGLNQHTLLLINGRPAGTTNLGTLDLNYMDHIEVLKGPASALYGSQAMGGVVNIITPQSKGVVHGQVFGDYGSFDTYQFGAKAGGNLNQKLDFDASATYFKRAKDFKIGHGNVFRNWFGADNALHHYADGREVIVDDRKGDGDTRPNTKYGYYTGSARLGYQLNKQWRVDLSGTLFRANDVESPGDITVGQSGAGLKDITRNNGEASLVGNLGKHNLSARVYYANERSTSYAVRKSTGEVIEDPYLMNINDYAWYGTQVRDALHFGRQRLILGYDYNHASSKVRNYAIPVDGLQAQSANSPNAAIITHGLYAQGQLNFLEEKLKINPGIRWDLTGFATQETPNFTRTLVPATQHNSFVSPSLSAQYALLPNFNVHGSLGRAFVTPDANQVAGYIVSGQGSGKLSISQGNPDLKNESSLSEEIGLKYQRQKSGWMADVTYFNTRVKDRIAFQSAPPESPEEINGEEVVAITRYYNADKSTMRGLEVMASYDFGARVAYRYSFRLFTNLTRMFKAQDITFTDAGESSTAITNVANLNINYGIEYGNNRNFSVRLSGRYVGRRWDTDYNDPERPLVYYPKLMTLDLGAAYTVLRQHQIGLTISNLTDENYYEKRGYNQIGRAFRLRYTYLF